MLTRPVYLTTARVSPTALVHQIQTHLSQTNCFPTFLIRFSFFNFAKKSVPFCSGRNFKLFWLDWKWNLETALERTADSWFWIDHHRQPWKECFAYPYCHSNRVCILHHAARLDSFSKSLNSMGQQISGKSNVILSRSPAYIENSSFRYSLRLKFSNFTSCVTAFRSTFTSSIRSIR